MWGGVNSSLQLSSGSVATVSGGNNTGGAHGQKKKESYSQGIRGSVGTLCLWGDVGTLVCSHQPGGLGGAVKQKTPIEEAIGRN